MIAQHSVKHLHPLQLLDTAGRPGVRTPSSGRASTADFLDKHVVSNSSANQGHPF